MAKPRPKQLNHRLFEIGTKWKHKRQGAVYFIQAKGQDEHGVTQHTLSLFDPHHHEGTTFFPVLLTWTTEEVLREFEPIDHTLTRYDRLMLD